MLPLSVGSDSCGKKKKVIHGRFILFQQNIPCTLGIKIR